MKKSLILGAAAFAAVAWAPLANAGDVKLGGYYMGRWQMMDSDYAVEGANVDNGERYVHRLRLNMDMSASEKSHAHMRVRVLDSATIEGADLGTRSAPNQTGASSDQVSDTVNITDPWEIRQLWLETEAWGIGIKFGEMPISLNDSILVGDDTSSNGGLLLSKTFGDVTAVAGNIRINEDVVEGADTAAFSQDATLETAGSNSDDSNLWALSLFGKAGMADYNFTLAYADIGNTSDFAGVLTAAGGLPATSDSDNLWAALTLSGKLGYVNAVGTVIYENGYNNTTVNGQWENSGYLGALRLDGNTGFGQWNAYGFIASTDFNNITNDNMVWSKTWDQGGPGGVDLLNNWANVAGSSSPSENMSGIGVGLTVQAGGWTINPMLDYAEVTKNQAADWMDSAVGGSLLLSTKIQKDTTLSLEAAMVDPKAVSTSAVATDNAYYAQAGIKMAF